MLALRGLVLVSFLAAVSCTDVATDQEFITEFIVTCEEGHEIQSDAYMKVMERDTMSADDEFARHAIYPNVFNTSESNLVKVRVAPATDPPTFNNEFFFEFFNVCKPNGYFKFSDCTKPVYVIPYI